MKQVDYIGSQSQKESRIDIIQGLTVLFEISSSPTLVADTEGNIIYNNLALRDMLSLSSEELVIMKLNNLIKKNEGHEEVIIKAIKERKYISSLNTIIYSRFEPSGKPVKISMTPFNMESEMCFLIHIYENEYRYSDQNKSDNNQSVANILSSLIENVPLAIYRSDPSGNIVYANSNFIELFGYRDLTELSKDGAEKLYARKIGRDIVKAKLTEFGGVKNERVLFQNKKGKQFWGLINSNAVIDSMDNAFYDGVITSVTEGATVEEMLATKNDELEKTNAQLDRFLYSTSHDLRAPLTSIMGLVNLMHMEDNSDLMESYVNQIFKSTIKLDNVIKDMLSFAKNTRQKVESKKIQFEALVNDVLLRFRDLAEFDKLNFVININDRLPFFGDYERIENIFYHIFKNAISYSDFNKENPYVRSDVNVYGDKVIIELVDNGIGISKKNINNIFDMFYRGTDRSIGSGLGLYIVKETLLKLKGKINVDSNVGHGSIFRIEIPNGTKGRLKSKKLKLYGEL